jgi:hypothetical protein
MRWIATAAFLAASTAAWAQAATKISFEVENLSEKTAKALKTEIRTLADSTDCAISGKTVTITIKLEKWLKLSDLLKAVEKVKGDDDLSIKYESLVVSTRVVLSFFVEENKEKVKNAISMFAGVKSCQQVGENLDFDTIFKTSGAKLLDISKAVARATGAGEDKAVEIINDLAWYGGDAPAAKPKPG